MTPPLLLLGLYVGLLLVGLALCGWAGHSDPAPEEARKATDAALRAALGHLLSPARLSALAVLLFAFGSMGWALSQGKSLWWFFLTPLVSPVIICASLFYAARKLIRTSGQMVGALSADGCLTLSARTTVGVVLVTDTAIGLLLLSVHAVAASSLGYETAGQLVLLTASSLGLLVIPFARAASTAVQTVDPAPVELGSSPNPGALATLVATAYHAPLLRLLSLVVLSTLGHATLLLALSSGATDEEAVLWLYPHLLKVLGLFSILFAGLVTRTSEDESPHVGWIRGGLVFLVLVVAGTWSLSSELPIDWAQTVPAGLSFLFAAFAMCAWFGRAAAKEGDDVLKGAALRVPQGLVLLGLLLVLILASGSAERESALPGPALLSLLLAGTLATAPIATVWLLARDLGVGAVRTRALAFTLPGSSPIERAEPSPRLLGLFPILAVVVVATCVGRLPKELELLSGVAFLICAISALLGVLILVGLLGLVGHSHRSSSLKFRILTAQEASENETSPAVDFESAVLLCAEAIRRQEGLFLLLSSAPALFVAAFYFILPPGFLNSLSVGLVLGFACLGTGLEFLLSTSQRESHRSISTFALTLCLVQALWLTTAGALHF